MTQKVTRRNFLKSASALAAACSVSPRVFAPSNLYGFQAPSDRLRIAAIGVGNMGQWAALGFSKLGDLVALCDVDSEYGIARTKNKGIGENADTYKDYRHVLDRDDIDVVSIVTPDHWHVKIAIEALQAGKHVFCEKPLTLTLEQDLLVRRACEKYDRVFQVGSQQRSQREQFMLATLMVRNGYLGDIQNIVCHLGECWGSGEIPAMDVPAHFDWDMWQGPAPAREFIAQGYFPDRSDGCFGTCRGHYSYRWWYDYAGGMITGWGSHHVDCALWALGLQEKGTGPVSVDGTDSEHPMPLVNGYTDITNRTNACTKYDIVCKFANGMTLHMVSHSPDGNGILFEGTKGRIHVNRERIKGKPFEELPPDAFTEDDYRALHNGMPYEDHKANFIRCIREGGKPVSDVASHVQAMHVCHLGTISARLKREIHWDPVAEKIVGDDLAASFFGRESRKGYEMPKVD